MRSPVIDARRHLDEQSLLLFTPAMTYSRCRIGIICRAVARGQVCCMRKTCCIRTCPCPPQVVQVTGQVPSSRRKHRSCPHSTRGGTRGHRVRAVFPGRASRVYAGHCPLPTGPAAATCRRKGYRRTHRRHIEKLPPPNPAPPPHACFGSTRVPVLVVRPRALGVGQYCRRLVGSLTFRLRFHHPVTSGWILHARRRVSFFSSRFAGAALGTSSTRKSNQRLPSFRFLTGTSLPALLHKRQRGNSFPRCLVWSVQGVKLRRKRR